MLRILTERPHQKPGFVDAVRLPAVQPHGEPRAALRPLLQLQPALRQELSLHQHQRPALRILFLAGQGSDPSLVPCLQHLVPGDEIPVKIRPCAVISLLFGHLGNQAPVDGTAVGASERGQLPAIRLQAHREFRERLRHALQAAELLIRQGRSAAFVAHGIYAGHVPLDIIVPPEDSLFPKPPRHGACPLSGAIDFRVGIAVEDVAAPARDAAHIGLPGHRAHRIAAPDAVVRGTGDAAHKAPSRALHRPVGLAGDHRAEIRLAHDSSHVVFLARYGAQVAALPHHGLYGLLDAEALRSGEGDVVLRVEVVFRGYQPGDAAHIGVRLHSPLVDAEGNLPLLERGGVIVGLLGLLRPQVLQVAACGLVRGVLHRDALIAEQVVPQLVDAAAHHLGLGQQGVHIGGSPVPALLQHLRQPEQVIPRRFQLLVQGLQIVPNAAAAVAGGGGDGAQMGAHALAEPAQGRHVALYVLSQLLDICLVDVCLVEIGEAKIRLINVRFVEIRPVRICFVRAGPVCIALKDMASVSASAGILPSVLFPGICPGLFAF